MTPIFDTHSHYDDEAFDEDREEVFKALKEGGIGKIADIGASIESSKKALELAKTHDFIYCALGVHPDEISDLNEENKKWLEREALSQKKCVAVGEIGLDYHWDVHPHDEQKACFEYQLDLARRINKPVVIHSRDAAKDTADVMRACNAGEIGGVVHCYSYSADMAREFLDMDFYFGIGGVLTYKNARKLVETVEYLPMEKIVLETDCPYLSPVPHRGERNLSLNITFVIERMAQIKKISEEEVRRITWENAHRMYNLPM
ncbi:MAG: TatD family hydrolase [Lachnospiraceae bacterium]|nr:TatD family hydrolase [Lachnospiraceae bacterium]